MRKTLLSLFTFLLLLVTPLSVSASSATSEISSPIQDALILTEDSPVSFSFPVTLKSADSGKFAAAEVITGVATVNIVATDPDGTVVTNWNFNIVTPTTAKIISYDVKLTYDFYLAVLFKASTFGVPKAVADQDERVFNPGSHVIMLSGSFYTTKGTFTIQSPYPQVSFTLLP